MANLLHEQPVVDVTSMDGSTVQELLTRALPSLGPCAPLPALFEEVVRAWRGLPVHSTRLHQADALLAACQQLPDGMTALTGVFFDQNSPWELRLLAATLLARRAMPVPQPHDEHGDVLYALAAFTTPESGGWYRDTLTRGFAGTDNAAAPDMLPLLAFLKGLQEETLSYETFACCVREAGVLHPDIAAHRPLRHYHRLLDYLGLSEEADFQQLYHQLVAEVWSTATPGNWACWQWVTVPGGPDIFPRALAAFADGEVTLVRLHELKYALLPPPAEVTRVLATYDPALTVLLQWLRPGLATGGATTPGGRDALRWLRASNQAAATLAYATPPWWETWCREGMPLARRVLEWLQTVALPMVEQPAAEQGNLTLPIATGERKQIDIVAPDARHYWIEQHLVPNLRQCCANLLLAQAALNERTDEIAALAATGDIPAMRALAMLTAPTDAVLDLLRQLRQTGGRPVQTAARTALERLARGRGLSGMEELDHQQLLAAAWELGPLAGERVRVGWEVGQFRLRISLHDGKVQLHALGPRGALSHIPEALRQSDAYRQARAAQREVVAQYRLFKQHLERYLLEGHPIAAGEFRYLLTNPVFAHLAERLVWRLADGSVFLWAAPDRWETRTGEVIDLTDATRTLTLAHPVQLAQLHELVAWQVLAADRRLVQPFKQLFREIYTTDREVEDACTRFAGRRIDPQRAYALLRAAGYAPGTGVAGRDWPGGVRAQLCWAAGVVSHDLFGPQRKAEVVTGGIWFTRDGTRLAIAAVDPMLFSETLRAADLLTTRAAIGDAELTSRETIALRSSLLREVARSFRLTNLAVLEGGQYALVLGKQATYRVNLASGTVMLEPEGKQIVLPHSAAPWSPEEGGDATTQLLGIILTLAHDDQIDDLTFRAQLPGGEG